MIKYFNLVPSILNDKMFRTVRLMKIITNDMIYSWDDVKFILMFSSGMLNQTEP